MMNDQNNLLNSNLPAFEDKPIGNKSKFCIPEYAQNEQPAIIAENQAVQKLPLIKRIQSKALKTKKQAIEQLFLLVKDNVQEYRQYEQFTFELISFPNISIVEMSLRILLMYLNGGQQLKIDIKSVIKTILEKCLASEKGEKQQIKRLCQEILFYFMDNKCQDLLMNELNEELLNKNPKIIGIALLFIAKLLNNYGIKRLKSCQRFYKHLQLISIPPKPLAKPQTIQFYKEVYKWMGENTLKEFKIHMEVKEQIHKFAKEYVKVPMQIKKGMKREQGNQGKKIYQMDIESDDNQEQVDVLAMFTSRWVDQVLLIQKWKDKKATLQEFIKKTKVNNILPHRELSHFITLVKRLLAENNINLLQCGFLITQNLSKGLKKHFYIVAKNIVPYIFAKLKDAKPIIVQLAQQTLKALLWTLSLDDIIQDIKACLDDKAYFMRIQIVKFLQNFASKRQTKVINLMRSLLDKIVRLTEDGNEIVRKESLQLLCSLKKYHEMKYFGDKLKSLDSKKLAVIQNTKGQDNQQMQLQNFSHQNISSTIHNSYENKSFQACNMQGNDKKSPQKFLKKAVSLNNKMKAEDQSAYSSVQSKSIKSVNNKTLSDLSSHNQAVRYLAYQEISTKCSHLQLKHLMFNIKSTAIRQSSPNLLKIILALVNKYCGNDPIDLQTLIFLQKHDWKKAKHLLNQFLISHKLTPEANDHARINNIVFSANKSTILMNSSLYSLKHFMKELQFLLTKMTNPIVLMKIQAAEHAIKLLQAMQVINNQNELVPNNGYNQECINKFCGMVRFRLNESEQIATVYCELLKQMIIKGILTKNKGLKLILQTILSKLKERKDHIKNLFQEVANTNSNVVFSLILGEIVKEVNEPLIEFIIQNNELFIRNAQLKAYICPFLNLLFNSDMRIELKENLQKILDQIVQLSGEHVLEAEFKKIKLKNAEQYLAKFHILVKNQGSNGLKNVNLKSDRLKMDQQNPWPLFATPNHILKLINMLISLKQPLPTLATPLPLNSSFIDLIYQFDHILLSEYSDILLKWVYWRVIIDPQEMIQHLVKFTSNIIIAVNVFLSEVEFTMLLSIMINIMNRFKVDYHKYIGQLLSCIYNIDNLYKERSLSFWVNLITTEQSNNQLPVDQILKVIMSYSADTITQHLPSLARAPQIVKNEPFLRFISMNFDHQFLIVSGFRVLNALKAGKIQAQLKPLLSDLGGPQNIIKIEPEQKRYYITQFQKLTSMQLQKLIIQINKTTDLTNIIDVHMKIIYSIVVPFMKKEISVINVYSYFRELIKVINCNQENLKFSHCLKDLTRMLMYFLIDLDENNIQNKEQITKSINKIILLLLDQSQSRHMLEVLFLLLKSQLNLGNNCNSKIQHLIYKCIGKVIKSSKFLQKWSQNLLFIITQTNNLFSLYDLKIDSPLIKTIKNTWKNDMINNPSYSSILEKSLSEENTHQILKILFKELLANENIGIELKEKENQTIKSMGNVGINKLMSAKKGQNS